MSRRPAQAVAAVKGPNSGRARLSDAKSENAIERNNRRGPRDRRSADTPRPAPVDCRKVPWFNELLSYGGEVLYPDAGTARRRNQQDIDIIVLDSDSYRA